jgi:hypothetical protein
MTIGKLIKVSLRDLWKNEERDFTTWLENNLDALAEALDLTLSVVEREKSLGTFQVDLVAEDSDGDLVAIENQLNHSDHDHLGKLLTYMANLNAKTAVWITSDARPEHVNAVVWLNEAKDVSFYLVKLEAFKIGTSEPAPLFTVIVGPSEEGREVGDQKRELAERHKLRLKFWGELLELAKAKGVQTHSNRAPSKDSYISGPTGKTGIRLNYVIWSKEKTSVELYIDTGDKNENKSVFDQLFKNKKEIEKAFGDLILWERLDGRRASRIRVLIKKGGLQDAVSNWNIMQTEMIETMDRFSKALKPYLTSLS